MENSEPSEILEAPGREIPCEGLKTKLDVVETVDAELVLAVAREVREVVLAVDTAAVVEDIVDVAEANSVVSAGEGACVEALLNHTEATVVVVGPVALLGHMRNEGICPSVWVAGRARHGAEAAALAVAVADAEGMENMGCAVPVVLALDEAGEDAA